MLIRICSARSDCSPVFMSDTVFSACSIRRKPSCISLNVAMTSFISLSFCSITFCKESMRASVSFKFPDFSLLQAARRTNATNKEDLIKKVFFISYTFNLYLLYNKKQRSPLVQWHIKINYVTKLFACRCY